MTRTNSAAFMAKTRGPGDALHLEPREVFELALRLAIEQAEKLSLSSSANHDRLGDLLSTRAMDGGVDG